MIKRFSGRVYAMLTYIMLCVLIISGACSTPAPEGFAIYLTEGDIPPSQMPILSHVDLAGQPVIAMKDIISYNVITHEILLTADAFDRISRLDVPVRGRSFVVCVDRQPIYWGAFWTPISSQSFDGVTIMKPLGSRDPKVIQIESGYPSSSFFKGEDPRNNLDVMRSLQQAGKLSVITSASPVNRLPHSLKGYELYSWPVNGLWHFTLVTGTNRNKTLEEVISTENIVSAEGWVHVHMVGLDALITMLSTVPQNELVSWLGGLRSEQTPQNGVDITLPASSIIDAVKQRAAESGINLMVLSP
ncbi:MAG: hypothetical protein PHU70_03195 [Dehalococcoidia bacterium]|nr:hypothetical protein [Dehalococcoidia bacterium]MDD5647653.1 hypothetical protein [Dehalococcoidia bacterium]